MKENVLIELSKEFALKIVKLCNAKNSFVEKTLYGQLLRSGTSIGANIHEANYAASRDDFINKLQIAMKECYETEYWLDLLVKSNLIEENVYNTLFTDVSKIRKILTSSILTAKNNKLNPQ